MTGLDAIANRLISYFMPSAPSAPTATLPVGSSPDLSQVSPESVGESWDHQLLQDVQGVTEADLNGGDPQAATATLQQDYQNAKQQGAPLSPQVEAAVQAILNPQQAGGGSPGQSDSGVAAPSGDGSGAGAAGGGAAPAGGGGASSPGPNGNASPSSPGNGDPWSPQLQQSLNSALTSPPEAFKNAPGSWNQGTQGNCASVATIKAAMNEYGNKVFDSVSQGPNGYNIRMQDGYQETLTPQMLDQASRASGFQGPDSPDKAYGTFLYASMAQRAAQTGTDGVHSFSQALNDLANGYDPKVAANLLGVENHLVSANPANLGNDTSVVGWSANHAVFIHDTGKGDVTDHYGSAQAYNGTDTNGGRLTSAFALTPASYPAQSYKAGTRPATKSVSNRPASSMPRPGSASGRAGGWSNTNPWAGTRHPAGR